MPGRDKDTTEKKNLQFLLPIFISFYFSLITDFCIFAAALLYCLVKDKNVRAFAMLKTISKLVI